MCNQCRVSFFKLCHFPLFYITIVCLAGMGFFYGFMKVAEIGGDAYYVFRDALSDTSLMFVLSLMTSWFVGSDFSNRTIHHEITSGYSRWSVLLVRELPVMLSGVIFHLTYVFSAMIGVMCKNGFSGEMFGLADVFWCGAVILQLLGLQSIIILITFICAKAPVAMAVSVSFTIIMCNILRNYMEGTFFTKTVFYLARDNSGATLLSTSIVAVVTLALSIALTYLAFRRKEIK